jgi:uncharacterized membrane protein
MTNENINPFHPDNRGETKKKFKAWLLSEPSHKYSNLFWIIGGLLFIILTLILFIFTSEINLSISEYSSIFLGFFYVFFGCIEFLPKTAKRFAIFLRLFLILSMILSIFVPIAYKLWWR